MRHTEAYKRRAISDTIKMCISPRCFKRELSLSRGAPPPRLPRNSSPPRLTARRVLFPCSGTSAGRNNNPTAPPPLPPSLNPRSSPDYHSPFHRFLLLPSRSRSFEKKDRLLPSSFLLLLLLLLLLRIFFVTDRVREDAAQVFAGRGREEKGIGVDFYGHGFGGMEKKTWRSGSNGG